MHIHLDPVGGIAGDMFVGALLDAYPERAAATLAAVRAAGLDESVRLAHVPFSDGTLSGSRFEVSAPPAEDAHDHVHWSSLRRRLSSSALAEPILARVLDIFGRLAAAEAQVHNKAIDRVAFHEVGAWDSIADIVAAASLIESLGPCTWSIGAVPVGSGRVATQHGQLPVPAPATVLLLDGFHCFDDGFPGERVTPTGAAIVQHLAPDFGLGPRPRRLHHSGYGFGNRRFDGMSNVLRVLVFEPASTFVARPDQVAVLRFEVDDQTPEDLALGLDRLREMDGVVDVVQQTMVGKRGRVSAGIRILVKPEMVEQIIEACFAETTTLGIRTQLTDRVILPRRETRTAGGVRVKVATRAAGSTAKAEISDVADAGGHADREQRRHTAQTEALSDRDDER